MERKVKRLNTKDKASSYSRTFGSKLYTWLIVSLNGRLKVSKNVKIERGVEFNITDNGLIRIGENSVVKKYAYFILTKPSPSITIGRFSGIGRNCYLSIKGTLTIGSYVRIGPDVCIIDQDHSFRRDDIIMNQPAHIEDITVQDDVWIGRGATILKGVTLGEGSIVAANALVNKSVPPYEIWGGIPAKKIGERN